MFDKANFHRQDENPVFLRVADLIINEQSLEQVPVTNLFLELLNRAEIKGNVNARLYVVVSLVMALLPIFWRLICGYEVFSGPLQTWIAIISFMPKVLLFTAN